MSFQDEALARKTREPRLRLVGGGFSQRGGFRSWGRLRIHFAILHFDSKGSKQ